jgi:hypothetical protein
MGASYRTRNFVVTAATPELARELATRAEEYRRSLAVSWLGKPLADWSAPCPVEARIHPQMRPNGLTSFGFRDGRTFGWHILVQGERERVLGSVLPHEITHAIFATHFGRPLPRWADEGVSITVEEDAARGEQHRRLIEYLRSGHTVSLRRLFSLREYPPDILPLYSQGYSLVSFLIEKGGRQKFVAFISDGMKTNDWIQCATRHYAYESLGDLQRGWLDWVADSAKPWPNAQLVSAPVKGAKTEAVGKNLVASDRTNRLP